MFGKGQGALGSWLREFCQLVFIQTLQAFIYAIILEMILKVMAMNLSALKESYTVIGMFMVVALISVFKVEDIVRKILGFGPTKADHGGAVKSLAKTAFAAHLGKKVLDNGKKITQGVSKINGSRKDASTARKQLAQDKADILGDANGKLNPDNKAVMGSDSDLLTDTMVGSAVGSSVGSHSSNGSGSSGNYNQRLRALQRQNEQKLKEIKKQRKEGIKSLASGVLETGGALFGGVAGAVIGGADGNVDEAIQGLMAGAGIGDSIGSGAVDATASVGSFATNRLKGGATLVKNVHSNYSDIRNTTNRNFATSAVSSVYRTVKNGATQVSQYKRDVSDLENKIKELNKKVENVD